ncbi:MAG: biotin carboxylase N-terminal domain-containing protein [Armatimonadota bacterium]
MKIKKLLVANRGEIAVRVFRTAKAMGIPTVAVYSDADKDGIHVSLADEAIHIGGSAPSESYLRIDAILDACAQTGADAVHPGYGFLSERDEFSEACERAGIKFLGPPAEAMRRLGGKIEAKTLAVESEVPITPGFFEPGATDTALQAAADKIGYPVMLKASAGGGGRGMRIVRTPAEFSDALALAKDEAAKGFGDDAMMVEKLVVDPRHIEVQFVADSHGQVACLFERECSIQRRHQKLVEEAPSALPLNPPKSFDWDAMQQSVRRLALAAGYVGAGTAEFMVDRETGEFYFLEVNARLQVEHPVTEAITGLDLVELQIRVAQGEKLDIDPRLINGDRAALNGHSIEVRIVAEDPAAGFMPSIGKIIGWAEPRHPGIRFDTGFAAGKEVSRFYDSMIAKVIAHGPTREAARKRLIAALHDFHVLGVKTNVGYLIDVLEHPGFLAGTIDTGFLAREFADWTPPAPPSELALIAEKATGQAQTKIEGNSAKGAWAQADGWRVFALK